MPRATQAGELENALTFKLLAFKEAQKGFFVVAVLVKRWKITKKDI